MLSLSLADSAEFVVLVGELRFSGLIQFRSGLLFNRSPSGNLTGVIGTSSQEDDTAEVTSGLLAGFSVSASLWLFSSSSCDDSASEESSWDGPVNLHYMIKLRYRT